jgi:phenylacetate-coenzyme A ligase PaaK-like adenylate-forming protein
VAPGEPAAKLYLTNLYNLTQPLIRFEIADGLTLFDDVCSCGSAHRRMTNLTGRADIVFDYTGGVRIHPMVLRIELHEERHVTEYQVRQTTRGLSVKVVTERPGELDEIRERLARTLRTAGLRDPEVNVEAVGRLERLASGKLRQFVPRLGG